jgi:hypothetical protein
MVGQSIVDIVGWKEINVYGVVALLVVAVAFVIYAVHFFKSKKK